MIQIFNLTKKSDKPDLFDFGFKRRSASLDYEGAVRPILEAIRRDGDDALVSYARELDGLGNICVGHRCYGCFSSPPFCS